MFVDNINEIDLDLHQLNGKLAIIELSFIETCAKLMESYLFLENSLEDIINSITFAQSSI